MVVGLTVVAVMAALVALGWLMGSRLRDAAAARPLLPPPAPAGDAGAPPAPPPTRRGVVSVFSPSTTTTAPLPAVPSGPDPLGAALVVAATEPPAPTTTAPPAPAPARTVAPTVAPTTTTLAPLTRVTGVGDSIMLGAAEPLAAAVADRLGVPIEINARVGRPFGEGIDVAHDLVAAGAVGEAVVVHLGTNGPVDEAMVREMLDQFRTARRVVLVNVRVPRDYEAPVNETLAAVGAAYPNVRLLDWYGATEGREELFWSDGVHLKAAGSALYAQLIADALAA